jgi:HEAT repeat protein
VRLLSEPDRILRLQVLIALAHIGSPTALNAIHKAMKAEDRPLANIALWALGAIDDPRADAILGELDSA